MKASLRHKSFAKAGRSGDLQVGTSHRPQKTDKTAPTLFDERRLPLAAATIGLKPIASIVIDDSTIADVERCLHDTWMETVRSAWRKGPTSMDRFENGDTN